MTLPWLKILAALGATTAIGIAAGGVVVFTGLIDVSADTPHSPLVYAAIDKARELAIDRQSREVQPPKDLSNPERVRRGAGNYAAMCANCHLAPGQENTEIRMGLYPVPPNLAKASLIDRSVDAKSARQFWIIKHGIKASGMPAWSKGGMKDAAIWDLTALINQLPALTAKQYKELVAASDGHSHTGAEEAHHNEVPTEHHNDAR